jgi:hypothetical protein
MEVSILGGGSIVHSSVMIIQSLDDVSHSDVDMDLLN